MAAEIYNSSIDLLKTGARIVNTAEYWKSAPHLWSQK
jgi:hypothetical protein